MKAQNALPSLRLRLLAGTLVVLVGALLLAGWFLDSLFRDHASSQFERSLRLQLDQLTARLDTDGRGEPVIDAARLSDPRWQTPYSGLYWQLDRLSDDGSSRTGVLRSRSLWDGVLRLQADALADGEVHVHHTRGPDGATLMVLERSVVLADETGRRWRLIVAGDLREMHQAADRFGRELGLTLLVLGLLLTLALTAQVLLGLAPLRTLQRAVQAVRQGERSRLEDRFPGEIQPLVDDFNTVLDRNTALVERARSQAGDLAHALKTPMAVLGQAGREAAAAPDAAAALPALLTEQLDTMQREVDWHLARARAAAAHSRPGLRTDVAPVVAGLVRVMERVHAGRGLSIIAPIPDGLQFAGESQDLQTLLGNLLDNACKWGRQQVRVSAREAPGGGLFITVDDDGPGISPDHRAAALSRGVRMDQSVPGTGLGLAIVEQLAREYGGHLTLGDSPAGGLRARLELPGVVAANRTG